MSKIDKGWKWYHTQLCASQDIWFIQWLTNICPIYRMCPILASYRVFHKECYISKSLLLWLYITYKFMGYQVFSLTIWHFDIYFSNRTTLDLSVQLTTVFEISKYMKKWKNKNITKNFSIFQCIFSFFHVFWDFKDSCQLHT